MSVIQKFNVFIRLSAVAALLGGAGSLSGRADGYIWFRVYEPPIRIGSPDGPIAESPIVVQPLVGAEGTSLVPVGEASPVIHGFINGKAVFVAGLEYGTTAALQLAAWDSSKWGLNFNDVPAYAVGKSSIGWIYINVDKNELPPPVGVHTLFVPVSVPEPSRSVLMAIGGLLLLGTLPVKRNNGESGDARCPRD